MFRIYSARAHFALVAAFQKALKEELDPRRDDHFQWMIDRGRRVFPFGDREFARAFWREYSHYFPLGRWGFIPSPRRASRHHRLVHRPVREGKTAAAKAIRPNLKKETLK